MYMGRKIKVYPKNAGIRSVTGVYYFNSMEEARPTIEAYEESKKRNPDLYDYVVEEEEE